MAVHAETRTRSPIIHAQLPAVVVEPLRLAPAEEDSVAAEALHTDKLLRPRAGIVGLAWTEASDVAELEELLEVLPAGATNFAMPTSMPLRSSFPFTSMVSSMPTRGDGSPVRGTRPEMSPLEHLPNGLDVRPGTLETQGVAAPTLEDIFTWEYGGGPAEKHADFSRLEALLKQPLHFDDGVQPFLWSELPPHGYVGGGAVDAAMQESGAVVTEITALPVSGLEELEALLKGTADVSSLPTSLAGVLSVAASLRTRTALTPRDRGEPEAAFSDLFPEATGLPPVRYTASENAAGDLEALLTDMVEPLQLGAQRPPAPPPSPPPVESSRPGSSPPPMPPPPSALGFASRLPSPARSHATRAESSDDSLNLLRYQHPEEDEDLIVAALTPGAAPATEGITAQPTWSDTGLIFPLTLSGNAPSPEDPRPAAGVIDELTEALTDVALIGLESTHSFMSVVDRVFIPRIHSADTVTDVAFNPGMDAAWIEEFLTEPLREDSVPIIHPQVQETLHACALSLALHRHRWRKRELPPACFPRSCVTASAMPCCSLPLLLAVNSCAPSRGVDAWRSGRLDLAHRIRRARAIRFIPCVVCGRPAKRPLCRASRHPPCGRPWSRGARGVPVDPPIERRHR